jgi:OOP family OmpA-OmpF porin
MTTIRRLLARCALGALLCIASLPAAAQGYFGISTGSTAADFCSQFAGIGLTSCDDKDTGFKFFGGARVNPNLALELGWVDLGEVTATGPGGTARIAVDGLQFSVLGIAPVNERFHLFGKFGLYLWDASVAAPGLALTEDGTDIVFGFGLGWSMTDHVQLRAEWEKFDVDGVDIDMLSVGLQYNF